jgi:hypothetical protein
MHGLVGNGQPGRIALLERTTGKLAAWRWYVAGAAAGGVVISVLAWFIAESRK